LTGSETILGTVTYMSPEQVRAEKVTAAADTYSLGVVLYELLVGQPPFRGATPHETMKLIETEPPKAPRQLNRNIAKDLETICLECLEKNPGNRYSSTADLADELDRWLRNESIITRPAGPLLRMGRWTKRNPLGMVLILSLSLALVAAVGLFWQWKKASDLRHTVLVWQWTAALDKLWLDTNLTSLTIKAEELANLERRRLPSTKGATNLTFALAIGDNPTAEAEAFAPFLRELQNRMHRANGPKVIFDSKVVKSYTRFNEVASGATDFMHLGAIPYWRAKELSPGVQAVVQDRFVPEAVFVVRTNFPITHLGQFEGKSFAFPDPSATLGLWAKVKLVQAGIRGANLSFYETIDDLVPIKAKKPGAPGGAMSVERRFPGDGSGVEAANRVRIGSLFESDDFLHPTNFVQKLRGQEDAVSQFLWGQLSPKTPQQALTGSDPKSPNLLDAVAEDLNHILTNALYDPQRFAGMTFSAETLALKAQNPQGEDLIRCNRLLLQDAYPPGPSCGSRGESCWKAPVGPTKPLRRCLAPLNSPSPTPMPSERC
jgi:ABC-type phosphate/phosphonate transport system substrate-binding protein